MNSASGQSRRKVVGIAIAAIRSGTNAIAEPNTNSSTIRAPTPPTSVSARTLGPDDSSVAVARASMPVMVTGAPATVCAAAAFSAAAIAALAGSKAMARRAGTRSPRRWCARPQRRIRGRRSWRSSPTREPGIDFAIVGERGRRARRARPGLSTVVPSGSWTTGTSGPGDPVAAVAVGLLDQVRGIRALAARELELRREGVDRVLHRRERADDDEDPGDQRRCACGRGPSG